MESDGRSGERRGEGRRALSGVLAAVVAPLLGAPIALPPPLLRRFPELAGARFRRGGLPPRVGGWMLGQRTVAAITLWRTIFVAPGVRLEPALLLHELGHVRQFEAGAAFPLRYGWDSLRRGYRGNRYEADAERYAVDRLREPRSYRPPSQDV